MSLFGAMNTAVSGLSAQSSAFGNISDNVANSQTIGYKRVDTSFIDYLTTSTAANNVPGAVVTRPDYVNNVEGTITQTDNTLALAITGQGFFAVSKLAGMANNVPTFGVQQEYTRAGDFQMDKSGYLVNSAGLFLNGWAVTNGVVNQNTLTPIQVSQTVFNPIATDNVALSANLPATPTPGTATATVLYTPAEVAAAAAAAVGTNVYNTAIANGVSTATADAARLAAIASVTTNYAAAIAGGATGLAAATTAAGLAGADVLLDTTVAADPLVTGAVTTAITNAAGIVVVPSVLTGDIKTPASPISSDINVYDALGNAHTVTLNWVQTSASHWTVQINVPSDKTGGTGVPDRGSADVEFGTNALPSGTVSDVQTNLNDPGVPPITTTGFVPGGGTAATLSFVSDFGSGNQTITVNLGTYGQANGVTQYAGTEYNLRGLTQNGVPPGAFSSVTTATNGDIAVNYDNGQSRVIARVPVITFNNPNGLQRQDGQSFTVSQDSGGPLAETASTNGAGDLLTELIESSNVDIASEFTKLIVAQRAYTANTKIVTTADELLQQTIDMKR